MNYDERMARLTARKIEQTHEKQAKLGARDEDDYGLVLPPESFKVDLPVRDALGQWSGLRSWAANFRWLMENHPCYIDPDDAVAATPNGRKAGEPISHGANPLPGFRKDGALTAMATAIASVQPGYGNTAPWQLEVDIGLADDADAVEKVMALIDGHFQMGGTLVNINVVDAEKIFEAHKDPSKYPDLVVRVTGFTAYFNSLSPDFRQLVVKRLIREAS